MAALGLHRCVGFLWLLWAGAPLPCIAWGSGSPKWWPVCSAVVACECWLTGSVVVAYMGLVTPWHLGSSQTRDQTLVPCIGRQILNHWTTRGFPVMFIFYFPLRVNQLIHIDLLWFLDSDETFVRQSLWIRIIYRLMWALSSLGASGPGWGEVWAASTLLLWGCGLWACLVGSRGPWVGSLKLWWYSRWMSGLQLHHCLPGHLLGLPGVLSQTLTSYLSQASSLPWLCLFSLSVPFGGNSGLTLWKPDWCTLSCHVTRANSFLCHGVLCQGSSGPCSASGTFPPGGHFSFHLTLASLSSPIFPSFLLSFCSFFIFSSIIKYFSPHFSLLSPFPPIVSLLSVLLQTLDNQLKSV